jgi:hypothetical protein
MIKYSPSKEKLAKIIEARKSQRGTKAPLTNTETGITCQDDGDTFSLVVDKATLVQYLQDKVSVRQDDAVSEKGNVACPLRDADGNKIVFEYKGLPIALMGNFLVNLVK